MANSDTTDNRGAWRLKSAGLFMRAGDAEADRLVRLADVRDWLMEQHEWPMERAADEVIVKLRKVQESGLELFFADVKRYAYRIGPNASMLSRDEIEARGGYANIDERLLGFEGVCNAILNGWIGEYRGYLSPVSRVDSVCVRIVVAGELWGWGVAPQQLAAVTSPFHLADFAALVAYRNAHPGASWADGNQIEIGVQEFRRRGGNAPGMRTKVLAAMADDLHMKRQSLTRAIFGDRKRKPKQPLASPLPTVSDKKPALSLPAATDKKYRVG